MHGDKQLTKKETKEIQNEAKHLEGHLVSWLWEYLPLWVLLGRLEPWSDFESKEGKRD